MRSTTITAGADRRTLDPMRGFTGPRDFLSAVERAGCGLGTDERLRPLAAAGTDEHSTNVDARGGFLLPEGLQPQVLGVGGLEEDPSEGRVRPVEMTQPIEHVVARVDKNHSTTVTGGISVSRRIETAAIAASRGEVELITLHALGLYGLTFATGELVMDSRDVFVQVLLDNFTMARAAKQLAERLNGTGVAEYLGILRADACIEVAAEAGQTAETVSAVNLLQMRRRAWGYRNAVWMLHPAYAEQVPTLTAAVGVGGAVVPIWSPGRSEGDHPDYLLGRPLFYCDQVAALGARGDVVLAAWSEYLDARRVAPELVESTEVRFLEHENAFRFWQRGDGQPWWRAALTPANSATTRSPYVTLAARAA